MFRESHTDVGGVQLNLAEGPVSGPPLLFLHGLARRWQDFSPLFGSLTPLWSIRALDQRGHGKSDRTPGSYRVLDYVGDVRQLLEHAPEPVAIVGHSLGGLTALGAAALVPGKVSAIVMLDPPGPSFLGSLKKTFYAPLWSRMNQLAGRTNLSETARELAEFPIGTKADGTPIRLGEQRDAASLLFMAKCLRDLDPEAIGPPLEDRWLAGYDHFSLAEKVTCPTLMVVADPQRGGMMLSEDAAELSRHLRQGIRVDLPGVGHLIHWQDNAATLRLLHGFLGSL